MRSGSETLRRGGELPQPYHPRRVILPPDSRPRKKLAPGVPTRRFQRLGGPQLPGKSRSAGDSVSD